MTLDRLRARRDELQAGCQEAAVRLERFRGALALCNELLAEAEGDGTATDTSPDADA